MGYSSSRREILGIVFLRMTTAGVRKIIVLTYVKKQSHIDLTVHLFLLKGAHETCV